MNVKKILATLCAGIITLSLSTAATATEYVPCYYCSTQHPLYCGGKNADESGEKSHSYGFLWMYTCKYEEELHFSVADCPINDTVWGSDHIYEAWGHTYDDAGKNICGQQDGVFGCI